MRPFATAPLTAGSATRSFVAACARSAGIDLAVGTVTVPER